MRSKIIATYCNIMKRNERTKKAQNDLFFNLYEVSNETV